MDTKKSLHFQDAGSKQERHKDKKKYLINMPRKLGLAPGKRYYFTETENGYSLNFGHGLYIGMPRELVENSPQLYTLIKKGDNHE